MPPEIWIGTVEISFTHPEAPHIRKQAFTVVTTWASSPEEFRQKCSMMLESYGWKLLGVETANALPPDRIYDDEVEDMLERTKTNPAAVIYGTFHTYPVM